MVSGTHCSTVSCPVVFGGHCCVKRALPVVGPPTLHSCPIRHQFRLRKGPIRPKVALLTPPRATRSLNATVPFELLQANQAPDRRCPAGWLPDPLRRYEYRYWDGTQWTDHVSRAEVTYSDPVAPAAFRVSETPGAMAVRSEDSISENEAPAAPGMFARHRAAKAENIKGRDAFEDLAARAAAGDSAALARLPAAVAESRRFFGERKFEKKRMEVLQFAIRATIQDDILSGVEENHLNHMLYALGVQLSSLQDKDPELWEEL